MPGRQAVVAGGPGQTAVLGDKHAVGPAADGETPRVGGVEAPVVVRLGRGHTGDFIPRKAAVARDERAVALRGGEPELRVVRGLLEIGHGGGGLKNAAPRTGTVLGQIDAGFAAGEDTTGASAVNLDGLGVFAALRQAVFPARPGAPAISRDRDAVGQREVDVVGRVGVKGDVLRLGHVPARANAPSLAAVSGAEHTVDRRGVKHLGVARVDREAGQIREVEAEMAVSVVGAALEEPAERDHLRADDEAVVDGGGHEHVVRRRRGGAGRAGEQRQQEEGDIYFSHDGKSGSAVAAQPPASVPA